MKLLSAVALLILLTGTLFAQEAAKTLTPAIAASVHAFKLKAELHETKVALVKANAEKLLLQAELEGVLLRAEQAALEVAAVKALGGTPKDTFDWSTLTLSPEKK